MVRPFRFAVQTGPFTEPDQLVAFARELEALGYEELYSYDHVGAVDPFAPLVAAAAATTTLRIGPLVLNNEFHNPVLAARTAATVDALSGGRLVLGLGTGYQESEHTAIGSPILPPGPRVTRFGESLEVLRSLLDTGACHLDGEHVQVAVDDLGVRPAQERVPFLIGGHGPRVVRLAARFADIFQFTGLVHGEGGTPSGAGFAFETVAERARWLAEAAGDRDADIERSALVQVVAIDGEGPTHAELAERIGLDQEVIAATPFVVSGSVEEVVDRLESNRETLGISHLVIRDHEMFAPVVAALAGR